MDPPYTGWKFRAEIPDGVLPIQAPSPAMTMLILTYDSQLVLIKRHGDTNTMEVHYSQFPYSYFAVQTGTQQSPTDDSVRFNYDGQSGLMVGSFWQFETIQGIFIHILAISHYTYITNIIC